MSHEPSTPVTEALDKIGVAYRLLQHSQPVFTCEEAASERGVPLSEMVKCMVFLEKDSGRVILACVPAEKRVALNRLKQATRAKSFAAISPEDVAGATGYPRGAIAPIGLPDHVVAVADTALLKRKNLNMSAGIPTAGVELSAWDFRKVFRGTFAQITE